MRAYEVVAMIIPLMLSDTYLYFVVTCLTRSGEEVLWKKLARFIEFVVGSLMFRASMSFIYRMKSNSDERSR